MRPIDAESLKYRRNDYSGYDDVGDEERKRGILYVLEKDIAAAPTIDAVPVVRCKDCKYYLARSDGFKYCHKHDDDILWHDDDFCSYGEKSEE